jgi:hypothetical protein
MPSFFHRLKCAEFLLLLVTSLLPTECNSYGGTSVTAEYAIHELHKLLGDAFVSVAREAEQTAAPFLEWQEKGRVFSAQTKQLLDLLDSSRW